MIRVLSITHYFFIQCQCIRKILEKIMFFDRDFQFVPYQIKSNQKMFMLTKYPNIYVSLIEYLSIYQFNIKLSMNIAIQGCLHGKLNEVYERLIDLQKNTEQPIDALIICGDFQALRDTNDLYYLTCPQKYRELGSFYQYYNGKVKAPFLTIFIGGNHQAVNCLRQSYFGGWIAQNIYYLGQAGSIILKKGKIKVRISGLSGIYNHRDFQYVCKTQQYPFDKRNLISAYHLKQLQVFRMELLGRYNILKKQLKHEEQDFDMFISHDWPQNIALYGNTQELYRYKSFLKRQIEDGTFGSPPLTRLMSILRPSYWFSAHMHIKYAALYPHQNNKYTHFLALDKVISNRPCISLLRFEKNQTISQSKQEVKLYYDPDWLKILEKTSDLQKQSKSYYKYQSKQLLCRQIKLMNSILESLIRETKQFELQKYEIKRAIDMTQLQQTSQILKLHQIPEDDFFGLIFPKKRQPVGKKTDNKNNDQIQLDL